MWFFSRHHSHREFFIAKACILVDDVIENKKNGAAAEATVSSSTE